MDDTELPRFFKVFVSHSSSDSLLIPLTCYDELPRPLPKTVILQSVGGIWNMSLKKEQDKVYLAQGWSNFVRDNSLNDGDFLTFVYDGNRIFEVSIFRGDGCKEMGEVSVIDADQDDSGWSDDTNTSSESETLPISKNNGKVKEEVMEDSNEEDSVKPLSNEDTETNTCSEVKISKNKGKKIVEVVDSSDEDSDSDYNEDFDGLESEENSDSDSSYTPGGEGVLANYAKPKAKNPKKKGKSVDDEKAISAKPEGSKRKRKRKLIPKIKNPEAHLKDPKNLHFETNVKTRPYELLVHTQIVKDYNLKFLDLIEYIDDVGSMEAEIAKWDDKRVCIKKWHVICDRNKLKKEDRVLCELFRNQNLVYAIRVHVVRGSDL